MTWNTNTAFLFLLLGSSLWPRTHTTAGESQKPEQKDKSRASRQIEESHRGQAWRYFSQIFQLPLH
jgi:hypothetical protein